MWQNPLARAHLSSSTGSELLRVVPRDDMGRPPVVRLLWSRCCGRARRAKEDETKRNFRVSFSFSDFRPAQSVHAAGCAGGEK